MLCGDDLFKVFDNCKIENENMVIVITDTTASMIAFGDHLRMERNVEHAFCLDHNLHLTCKLAFDGASFLKF